MSRVIEVYIGQGDKRRLVTAELVRWNPRSVWVRLPDGNVVKRKSRRDLLVPVAPESTHGWIAS